MNATVIIPAYQAATFIERCLESALLQGEAVAELFVVDNASTDGAGTAFFSGHDIFKMVAGFQYRSSHFGFSRSPLTRSLSEAISIVAEKHSIVKRNGTEISTGFISVDYFFHWLSSVMCLVMETNSKT